MVVDNLVVVAGFALFIIEIIAILCAFHAVMNARTSQAAIAWAISLIAIPYIALPLYGIFGRRKFYGYIKARRAGDLEIQHIALELGKKYPHYKQVSFESRWIPYRALERLATMPFTGHNEAELLIDGRKTFDAIFRDISQAKEYILVQFYIVRDDDLGREFKTRLIERARHGVRIYFLYDPVGCHGLPDSFKGDLVNEGVEVRPFISTGRQSRRLQINFRNHRKIVVVDGRVAFVGGHNVGVEYLGLNRVLSPWRDTHVKVQGPSVQGVQLSFIEDWYWAAQEVPVLNWDPEHLEDRDLRVLVLPSGPADELDTCGLFFVHAINSASSRLWIISPYFVPDEAVMSALKLAALRGVDVRIMLPEKPDHRLVHLAAFSYFEEASAAGIKMYRYQKGFLHQKVMLIDDDIATVGTANLDNRSFRLNFELTMLFADTGFAALVAQMLNEDFLSSTEIDLSEVESRSLVFKVATRVARLLSPIL